MKLLIYFLALLAVAGLFCYVVMSSGDNPSVGTLVAFAVLGIVGLILLRSMKIAAHEFGKDTTSAAVEKYRAAKDKREGLSEKEYERRLANREFTKKQAQEMRAQKPKGFDQVMSQFQDDSDS
jgi:hypothetical protein